MVLKRKQEEVLQINEKKTINGFYFQVHLLRRQMRSGRVRKTTKEMTAHYAAIQHGVCSQSITFLLLLKIYFYR